MALHTQQSVWGFIATEPQQTTADNGDARMYVQIGQPHSCHDDDGSFTELEPTFHDMVVCRATAERAIGRFAKGDSFIAEGYTRTFPLERDGLVVEAEEFVAMKLGHDLARTNYQVDRGRRGTAPDRQRVDHGTPANNATRQTHVACALGF